MPVIFSPEAMASIATYALAPALIGENMERGRVYSGEGERVAENLTIFDDQLLNGAPNTCTFDDEGVPSRKVLLVEDGIVAGGIYDLQSAGEFGRDSTSSGLRFGRFSSGTRASRPPVAILRNLSIQHTNREDEMDLEEMVTSVKNGLLVHEVMGAHTANPASGDFTVSSSMAQVIRNGERNGSIPSVTISGNLPEILKRGVHLSRAHRAVPGSLMPTAVVTPYVLVPEISCAV